MIRENLRQSLTFDVVHDDIVSAVLLEGVDDSGQVGMSQTRQDPYFSRKLMADLLVIERWVIAPQLFESPNLRGPLVRHPVHRAGSPAAEYLGHLVAPAQQMAWSQIRRLFTRYRRCR